MQGEAGASAGGQQSGVSRRFPPFGVAVRSSQRCPRITSALRAPLGLLADSRGTALARLPRRGVAHISHVRSVRPRCGRMGGNESVPPQFYAISPHSEANAA